MSKNKKGTKSKPRKPRVLVLEGLSGAAYCIRRSGGEPINVDPWDFKRVDHWLINGSFDAMLLTGGGDVDPRLYGAKPHKKIYGVSETRDLVEMVALDVARERGIPVLGICRGAQMIAVHAGGTLYRHLDDSRGHHRPHLVLAERGTNLRRKVGNAWTCVSHHHQAINRVPQGFRIAARSKDGLIEAIESLDGLFTGVQFHPEMNYGTNEASRTIFRQLILQAARVAGMPAPRIKSPVEIVQQRLKDDAKHRRAGTRTTPATTIRQKRNKVYVSWLCPDCGMRFDDLEDREDHVRVLHGSSYTMRTLLEPPPDHPDWEPLEGDPDLDVVPF